jgi:hypothetical protein
MPATSAGMTKKRGIVPASHFARPFLPSPAAAKPYFFAFTAAPNRSATSFGVATI